MKKIALKGLLILGAIVLVCIFFSGTLHTLTTAKVQTATARMGRLESKITLTGQLFWPAEENVYVSFLTSEDTLTVRRLAVAPGTYVEAGALLAECEVSDYDTRLETLRTSYASKESEYLEQLRKYGSLVLTPQQQLWQSAWTGLQQALSATAAARQELRFAAEIAGVTLTREDALPEDLPPDDPSTASLRQLRQSLTEALAGEQAARDAFERANRVSIGEDLITYLTKKAELESEMENLSADITRLRILREKAAALTAPHAGYITAAELKAGDSVSRVTTLVQMTPEGVEPVIRLNAADNRKSISAGLSVELSAGSKTLTSTVAGQGVSSDGTVCVDVALPRGGIAALGGADALQETGTVTGQISWRSEGTTTLIPTAALRGTEGDWYVYLLETTGDALGGQKHTVTKKTVTVLGQSDTVTSIEENLGSYAIAYMEDRLIKEGSEVMRYSGEDS